jgi:hypothetical protein
MDIRRIGDEYLKKDLGYSNELITIANYWIISSDIFGYN